MRRLKSLVKWCMRALIHALYPLWRYRARRKIAAAARPLRSILVLCLGNVCRSPYAEAALRRMDSGFLVDSAGFIGPGRAVPGRAHEAALERGLDLSAHTSKLVTPELARGCDLIVVMDPVQQRQLKQAVGRTAPVIALGDLDTIASGSRTIADPWGGELDVFRDSFDRIDRCLAELRHMLGPSRKAGLDGGASAFDSPDEYD